ncbi:MAG: hypothetical protein RLZZ326_4381 [Planctomycetota bacterium]
MSCRSTTPPMFGKARHGLGAAIALLTIAAFDLPAPAAPMEVLRLRPGATASETERDDLETDRDTFTFAPTTAGAGRTITEASYSFIDNATGPEAHSFPELLVRRGIGERFELRLGVNYEAGGPGLASGNQVGGEDLISEEESRMLYGAKLETTDQAGWIPMSALIVQGFTPLYGPTHQSTMMVGEAWAWRFANGWEWRSGLRWGTGWAEQDFFNQWAPSTALKIPLNARWEVHAEYFGIMTTGKEKPINVQYGSCGGHVLLTKDLELGLRFGWGLNDTSPNFFANTGFGYRY